MGQRPDPKVSGLGQDLRAPGFDILADGLGVGGEVKALPGHRGGGDGAGPVVVDVHRLRQQGHLVGLQGGPIGDGHILADLSLRIAEAVEEAALIELVPGGGIHALPGEHPGHKFRAGDGFLGFRAEAQGLVPDAADQVRAPGADQVRLMALGAGQELLVCPRL